MNVSGWRGLTGPRRGALRAHGCIRSRGPGRRRQHSSPCSSLLSLDTRVVGRTGAAIPWLSGRSAALRTYSWGLCLLWDKATGYPVSCSNWRNWCTDVAPAAFSLDPHGLRAVCGISAPNCLEQGWYVVESCEKHQTPHSAAVDALYALVPAPDELPEDSVMPAIKQHLPSILWRSARRPLHT